MHNIFQSTHPRGVRHVIGYQLVMWVIRFQSTHPRGVRLDDPVKVYLKENFNPRTRVGCDLNPYDRLINYVVISIHAPAWGATIHR